MLTMVHFMKQFGLFSVCLMLSTSAVAQVRVGEFYVDDPNISKLDPETMTRFKGRTTKFILPSTFSKEEYESILEEVWTVTPFEVMVADQFNGSGIAVDDAIALFRIVRITQETPSGRPVPYLYIVLDLQVVDELTRTNKDGGQNWRSSKVASVYFTPDIAMRAASAGRTLDQSNGFMNFKKGYLKNFLQFTDHCLRSNTSFELFEDYSDPDLANLRSKPLLIDKTLIAGYDALKFEENSAVPIAELMEDYSFEYKVVEPEELEGMIMGGATEAFYYLMYSQLNGVKVVTVINGLTGEIIFQRSKSYAYNLNAADMKELQGRVQKAK